MRRFFRGSLFLVGFCVAVSVSATPQIELWYGERQSVGRHGMGQDDFNVLGSVAEPNELATLAWSLNGGPEQPLSFRAYRRLARDGDFNAEVPAAALRAGENTITVKAAWRNGTTVSRSLTLTREDGTARLPCHVAGTAIRDPQTVGQYVDGHWQLTPAGLRTRQTGYDRLFLIGDRTWRDYDVQTTVTVHRVEAANDRYSGPSGLGIIWRFAGHVVGGPRRFPVAQPKWGYQPFGAIGWLRWVRGAALAPELQFYPGDNDRAQGFGAFEIQHERPYSLRLRCETLPDSWDGEGNTCYSFKIWSAGAPEPAAWSWQVVQSSRAALSSGGLALVAHHVDATFGDIQIDATPAMATTSPDSQPAREQAGQGKPYGRPGLRPR